MPSSTDFNLSPYYDDFSEANNFHRILFRPAFSVQARELTQSQTILQNQIERFGDHMFKQGAMVIPGQVSIDTNYTSIKLTSKTASTINSYNNAILTGVSSGVKAKVVGVSATDGTDPDTLFIKYEQNGTDNVSFEFTAGETLNSSLDGNTVVVASTHTGSAAGIKTGIYYINGFFVRIEDSTLVLDKYTNTPSYRVGLKVTESFITENEEPTLVDQAQGVSNTNAPGAHRFKISLALEKKTLASTEDENFFEIARVDNGEIKSFVRSTEYAVLEETLARRTFDESGDYVLVNPDFDVREHLSSGDNRGIYSASGTPAGDATKIAIGVSPFKAYVNGYENEKLGTTFVDFNKARDFDTANNIKTRFIVDNYFNVTNVYGSPDVGFVSGDVEAFKTINLYDRQTSSRGVEEVAINGSVPHIGRAKSRGFQYVSGTQTNDIFANTGVWRHYLFDVELFTHLHTTTAANFTTGEIVVGSSSGATGVVQSVSGTLNEQAASMSALADVVVFSGTRGLEDGMQVTLSGGDFLIDSVAATQPAVFTIRNHTADRFELYSADGLTKQNITSVTTPSTVQHGNVVVSNVKGNFIEGETIVGQSSNSSAAIQQETIGFKGVQNREINEVKQIGMAGSPTYTADASIDNTYGVNETIQGNISIANSDGTLRGKGTNFQVDLKIGDLLTFTNDAGGTENVRIQNITSPIEAEIEINVGAASVTTAAVVTRKRAKLTSPENNIMLFKLPYKTVKTLKTTTNSNQTDTNFQVRRQFTATLSSNGDATISAGTNETFSALNQSDYSVSIMSTGSGSLGAVGDTLSLSGTNHEGDNIFTLSGSPVGRTLNIDFGANFAGHKVKILSTISRSVAGSKTKTLNTNQTSSVSSQTIIESGIIPIGKADILKVNNVYMSGGFGSAASSSDTDITDRFDLDDGQRDNFYDIGRLKLKPGAIRPTGQLLINFDFFSHGAGDYFDVDSYSGVVNYEEIKSYTSDTTGEKFELRDTLDFRPRVDDASTVDSGNSDRSYDGTGSSVIDVPKFNSDITGDLEFYLSRVDKLFLTREGDLKVVEGASDLNPLSPENLEGHMLMATINIPSYTLNTEDVKVEREDNKRYTMRDIGSLERRIKNVEYYTQLSLLEADAQSLQIQDADGFDRFKNGFVVDNFTGHNVGDVGSNDYKLAIDMARGEARSRFTEDAVELIEVDDKTFFDGTFITEADRVLFNYAKTGDLITLPYTETNFIQQPYATKTENLNPFLIFNWIGDVQLDPPVDEWKETRVAPEVVANVQGGFDILARERGLNSSVSEIPVGTVWNEWQDQWSGNPRTSANWQGDNLVQTTSRTVGQVRSGIRTTIVPQTVRQSLGQRVIAVAFVPFIRSRTVSFEAYGMRPNTRVFPFFDNINVSAYITPNGGSLGGNLTTNSEGFVQGTFAIPDPNVSSNPRWRTGKRVFRLTSSSTNTKEASAVQTSAEADYDAKGLLETTQEAIISTREPRTQRTSVTSDRTINRSASRVIARRQRDDGGDGGDPLAQSFIVDEEDGIFITSLDVYFKTKSSTIPVKAEIRNMVNGYPGPKVLPFAQKWLSPSAVNTSDDGSTATTFTFDSPVYLQEGVEYSIVLYSDSVDYQAYVARLGEKQINSNRLVSSQPNIGILFKSANNRSWTAEQMEDMKFTLKKAVFDTSAPGTLTLCNKNDMPVKTLRNNPIRTFNGSGTIRVFHPNHGMHSSNDNVIIAGLASGNYNGIAHSDINGTYTTIKNITLDSYDLVTSGTATATGDIGGATVTASQNIPFNLLQLQIGHVAHPLTSITPSLRTTTGKSVHGSETSFVRDGTADRRSVVLGDNIYWTEPRLIASRVNELNEMAGQKSIIVNLSITTSNPNLSPVIDLKRCNAFAIANRLNNPIVSSTDTFTGDGSTTGFILSSTPSDVHLLAVKKSGKKLSPVDDFTVSGAQLNLTNAPASGANITAKLTNTVDYEDDTATEGGSSDSSYITRTVSLESPSTALDVRIAASVRSSSSIKMFFRLTGGEETRRIQDIEFTSFNTDGSSDTNVPPSSGDEVNDIDFKDYKFSSANLPEFTSFQIKIVFRGINSAYPARLKDFRAIALAV